MPSPRGILSMSLVHDIFLKNSYNTATRPKFSLLLKEGGGCGGFLAHFWGKKCFFAPILPL